MIYPNKDSQKFPFRRIKLCYSLWCNYTENTPWWLMINTENYYCANTAKKIFFLFLWKIIVLWNLKFSNFWLLILPQKLNTILQKHTKNGLAFILIWLYYSRSMYYSWSIVFRCQKSNFYVWKPLVFWEK